MSSFAPLIRLEEPPLLFKYGQSVEDPRDGLTLFGPLDEGRPYGVRAGVIGIPQGEIDFVSGLNEFRVQFRTTQLVLVGRCFPALKRRSISRGAQLQQSSWT